jgi:hypothetical protein
MVPNYGPAGVFDSSYGPTMNNYGVLVTDRFNSRFFYLVFGHGQTGSTGILFNDVWKFDTQTLQFAW